MSNLVDRAELEQMMACGCHFGHRVAKWNPKMRSYIYGERDGIHVFDLTKTFASLNKACDFLRESAALGKSILIVSTKLQATRLVADAATRCGISYVTRKWIPGLLTNFDTIKKRIKYFRDLKEQEKTGALEKYTKKERLEIKRTMEKLHDAFSGVETMTKLPDVVVVLDALRDELALREARKIGIATVAVCDSNADPDLVAYPIPGNDDALKSLQYFTEHIATAILEGVSQGEQPVKKA